MAHRPLALSTNSHVIACDGVFCYNTETPPEQLRRATIPVARLLRASQNEDINEGAVVQVRAIMTELKAKDAPPPVQREEAEPAHQEAQSVEPGHTVGSNQDEPTVTYNYSRLCFKASSIKPL